MYEEKNEFYALEVNSEGNLLTYTAFPHDFVMTDEQVKFGFMKTSEILERFKPAYFISDSSRQVSLISPEMQVWIAENIYPRWVAAGLKKLAIIVPHDFIVNLSMQLVVDELEQVKMSTGYEIQYFEQIEDAKKWLFEK